MTVSPSAAAKRLLALRDAQTSYLPYLKLRYPDREFPPFQLQLIDALDRLEKGTLGTPNLLITMPPRHGKSEYGTVNFPPYFIGRDPRRYVMSSSYNAILAADFGKQARNISEEKLTSQIFPTFKVASDSRASDVWRTTSGGAYFGVGLDGTTSGRPANALIVDDPFKSREDADSPTMRNKVWNFYTSALTTRLQPDPSGNLPIQIVILTRWHPDDLAGRIMQTDDWKNGLWTHINFPAIDEHNKPLWPGRFDLEWLERRKALSERDFASLYQQTPYIEGGNLIKTTWLNRYDDPPPAFVQVIITADTAYKTAERNDYTAILVSGITPSGDIYILEIHRAKLEVPDAKRKLIEIYTNWRARACRGIFIEDKASGQSLIQELKRASGLPVYPHKVMHDKVARVSAILPIIESGRVYIPSDATIGNPSNLLVEELRAFPSGKYDDQVDAFTMAIDILTRTSISPSAWDGDVYMPQSLDAYGKSLRQALVPHTAKFRGWGL